jgi:predicted enzyme related to lactoylglutathione lyase
MFSLSVMYHAGYDLGDDLERGRPMTSLQLGSVIIATQDKARLKTFYHEVLGIPYNAQGKLESGGVIIHPALHSEVHGPPAEPHRVMLTFEVAEIHTAATDLQARGVAFVRLPERENWGGWLATFLDPDGNYLQLIQLAN